MQLRPYLHFTRSSINVPLLLQDRIQGTALQGPSRLPRLLWAGPVCLTALVFMTVTVLRCAGQVFCSMSLSLGLSDVFSHDHTRVMSWGEDSSRGEGPFLSHHIRGLMSHDVPDHLARGLPARSLPTIAPHFPFSSLFFRGGPALKECVCSPPPPGGRQAHGPAFTAAVSLRAL